MGKNCQLGCALFLSTLLAQAALADAWDPPANFYDSATGTGATLKSQLQTIMSNGHIQRSYGDFRYSSRIHDADPDHSGNILLVYNRQSVSGGWDSGATWNREHVWPQSRQPGDASNSSRGNLGDPHSLRPCNTSLNGSRGNKPYAYGTTFGNYSSQGSYWFPGDADKGDIARCLFYSATRYSGLTLVDSFPSGYQMGNLSSCIAWNYLDPPDEFERRRNHTIFSSAYNPTYYTNNRNAYIDRPEFVWSVYGPGANDSTIYVGAVPAADGSSYESIELGPVIVGAAMPADVSLDLSKDGADPTYYEVTTSGAAYSSISGRYNPFIYDPQTISLTVGLDGDTNTVGTLSGSIEIDNLDPSSGGVGQGSDDGDDVIDVTLQVLRSAAASFESNVVTDTTTVVDSVDPNSTLTIHVPVYNVGFDADQAELDIDSVTGLSAGLTIGSGVPSSFGSQGELELVFDSTNLVSGEYTYNLTVAVSDEDVPGAASDELYLDLQITVTAGLCGDMNCDGVLDVFDIDPFVQALLHPSEYATNNPNCDPAVGDLDGSGAIDVFDIDPFVQALLGGGCQ